MQDFKKIETSALIDLLAQYTEQFTNKITGRANKMELEQYEYEIAIIQSELNSRKMTSEKNTVISDSYTQISPTEPSTNSNN